MRVNLFISNNCHFLVIKFKVSKKKMVEIKDKVKEIEDRISELEVVNVSLHNLKEWYNPTDFWNEHSLWYFGRDKLLDKKGYRTLWEVKEVVVSLATGHIASRLGAILEEKKPYRILTHIPPPEALNVVREVIGNYRGSHCEILKYSFTWFKKLGNIPPPNEIR